MLCHCMAEGQEESEQAHEMEPTASSPFAISFDPFFWAESSGPEHQPGSPSWCCCTGDSASEACTLGGTCKSQQRALLTRLTSLTAESGFSRCRLPLLLLHEVPAAEQQHLWLWEPQRLTPWLTGALARQCTALRLSFLFSN